MPAASSLLAFVCAVASFATVLVTDYWAFQLGELFVGLVCWTVFVQDHMSGKTRR